MIRSAFALAALACIGGATGCIQLRNNPVPVGGKAVPPVESEHVEPGDAPKKESAIGWPLPRASTFHDLSDFFPADEYKTLADVAAKLNKLFDDAGYDRVSWHDIPGGFATVTRLEQIDDNGKPLAGKNRWNDTPILSGLGDIISGFFVDKIGRYRTLVFAVTNHAVVMNQNPPTLEAAKGWEYKGSITIPEHVHELPFSADYKCVVLIYEFVRHRGKGGSEFVANSVISAMEHLRLGGIHL